MLDPREHLALGGTIALQLIRDNDAGHVLQALEQRAKALLRGLRVAPLLDEDVQDVVVLIHRAPQGMAFTIDRQKPFIQMPCITRLRATATQPIGVILPKLPAPLADGFVGHGDAAFQQECLYVAVAPGEVRVEPDPVTDDFTREAVILVALGVGWRGHAWLSILVFDGS